MKLNRRGFLSLGLGASAGLSLTPLPWKLLDDISIWTQNWPWVPVPKDGRVSKKDSVCTLCPGGCPITVRRIDERVVSVAGGNNQAGKPSGLCPLGLSGPQLLYTPTRVMSPMLRVRDQFRKVSWNKAFETLLSNLKSIGKSGNPGNLAAVSGTGQGLESQLLREFLLSFGSSAYYSMPAADDSWEAVTQQMAGEPLIPGYDLENSDMVFSFGCGLLEGWGSPVDTISAISRLKDNSATLVQIEPRLSNTAAADRWVAIRPGSEFDLAFGICLSMADRYSLQRQRLAETVSDWTACLADIRRKYPPEQVSASTGLSRDVIEELADRFANSERPLAVCGTGEGRSPIESGMIQAALLLNIMAGTINQPGGLQLNTRREGTVFDMPPGGSRQKSAFQQLKDPEQLIRKTVESKDAPVEMLLISGTNPCYELNDSKRTSAALEKIPFVVSFTSHWDETAVNADLVLPIHSHLESYRDFQVYSGLPVPRLGLSRPVSKRLFNSKYTGDVIIELANRMGGPMAQGFPWPDYVSCLRENLKDQWDALKSGGRFALAQPSQQRLLKLSPGISKNQPVKLSGNKNEYPLILIPKSSMRLSSGTTGSSPFMVKSVDDTDLMGNRSLVDINPQSAAELNLDEGVVVKLETPNGSAEVQVHLDDGIMPGVIAMAAGLGHSAYDAYLAHKGASIHQLLDRTEDSSTGQRIVRGARAKLNKA